MTSPSLARAARALLDLVYPPSCALCRKGDSFLCAACASALPAAEGDRCDRCWLPLFGPTCFACREHPLALDSLRSCYRFIGDARRLVLAFKFRGQSCLAEPLGQQLAHLVHQHGLAVDALVPVPLRGMRQRERGYNQAMLLAREAGRRVGVPVLEALERRRGGPHQAQTASGEQRRRNVEGVFRLRSGAEVYGLSLVLVDDVATTGATLDACARVLLTAGAASVSAVTVARED